MSKVDFIAVIPARYQSTRFPGKPLVSIQGKPMIQHVYERACKSGATEVIIATDDERIMNAAQSFGARVCMTSADHQSGSDRLAELARQLEWQDQQIVVNVQGDEPRIPAEIITQVAADLSVSTDASISTLCAPIQSMEEVQDPNIVKVVFDKQGYALYFSRSVLPYKREDADIDFQYYRHIGLYAYRAGFLKRYTQFGAAPIEQLEQLEQLRAMWHGEKIHVALAKTLPGPGIDTPEDLEKLSDI